MKQPVSSAWNRTEASSAGAPGGQAPAYLLALASVLCWSTVATAFKLALRTLEVPQLLFLANLTAVGVLLTFVITSGRVYLLRELVKNDWRRCLVLGLVNPFGFYLVVLSAYDLLPAQVAQPLNLTWAFTLSLLAVPLLGQRISWRDWLAIVIAYVGVLVICLYGHTIEGSAISMLGVFLALASTVLWSLYWIYATRAHGDAASRLTLNFLFALPATFLVCLLFSGPFKADIVGIAAAIWVGVLELAVPFLTWQMAMSRTHNAARISALVFLTPFLSLQLIQRILGEPIQFSTYLGLMLILVGLSIQKR